MNYTEIKNKIKDPDSITDFDELCILYDGIRLMIQDAERGIKNELTPYLTETGIPFDSEPGLLKRKIRDLLCP